MRTNKYDDPNQDGGKGTMINIEQIRLQPNTNRNNNQEDLSDDEEKCSLNDELLNNLN